MMRSPASLTYNLVSVGKSYLVQLFTLHNGNDTRVVDYFLPIGLTVWKSKVQFAIYIFVNIKYMQVLQFDRDFSITLCVTYLIYGLCHI